MITIDAYDLATYVKAQQGGPWLTILDEVRDLVFVKDVDGRFLYNNRAHQAQLGYTAEQLYGKTDFDLFPRQMAESFYAAETHMLETMTPVVRLQESLDAKGQKHYSTAIKLLICDRQKNVLGLIGTVHRILRGDQLDLEQSKAQILSLLHQQVGITPSQMRAFETSLPNLLKPKR